MFMFQFISKIIKHRVCVCVCVCMRERHVSYLDLFIIVVINFLIKI